MTSRRDAPATSLLPIHADSTPRARSTAPLVTPKRSTGSPPAPMGLPPQNHRALGTWGRTSGPLTVPLAVTQVLQAEDVPAGQQQGLEGPGGPVGHHHQPVLVLHHQPLLRDTELQGAIRGRGHPTAGDNGTRATSSPCGEPPARRTPAAWAHRAGAGTAAVSAPPGAPRWGGSCWPTPGRDTGGLCHPSPMSLLHHPIHRPQNIPRALWAHASPQRKTQTLLIRRSVLPPGGQCDEWQQGTVPKGEGTGQAPAGGHPTAGRIRGRISQGFGVVG